MRHKVAGRKLSRTSAHRLAMRRNLVASLFEHETISTTMEKAKEVRPFAEKLITLAKKGTLAARRRAIELLGDRDIVEYEDNKPVRTGSVIGKLFSELGPRYLDRPGGYTRIIRLSMRRLGDNGQLVLLQLVAEDEGIAKKAKVSTRRASRRRAAEQAEEATAGQEAEEAAETEGIPAAEAEASAQTEDAVEDQDASEEQDTGQAEKTEAASENGEDAPEGKQ